ncbi:MAG TPA: DUF433 domain-containing protein [Chitinophagales bacterium]|nr:DUF433 domain-containing protein [Chitinophagales bacterium]
MENLLSRITTNPNVCKGKPCIRDMRFTVTQLLELLASGMSFTKILSDYPYLEKEDIEACLLYASKIADAKNIIAISA